MTSFLVEVKQLGVGFQVEQGIEPVIHGISFAIQRGETFALVGESGCGKSITALSIMQLLPPAARVKDRSQIFLDGVDLLQLSEIQMRAIRGRRIGMIFQEAMAALNPVLTIGEQINEVLTCHFQLSKLARREKILDLLKFVNRDFSDSIRRRKAVRKTIPSFHFDVVAASSKSNVPSSSILTPKP